MTPADSGGFTNDIAYYSGGWQFLTPELGWLLYVQSEAVRYEFNEDSPPGWNVFVTGGGGGGGPLTLDIRDDASPPVTVDADRLVFDSGDFALTESPAGTARVSLVGGGGGGGGGLSTRALAFADNTYRLGIDHHELDADAGHLVPGFVDAA